MKKLFISLAVLVMALGIIAFMLYSSIGPIKEIDMQVDLPPEQNIYNIFERSLDSYHDCRIDITLSDREATDLLKYFLSEKVEQKEVEISGTNIVFRKDKAILSANIAYNNKTFGVQVEITKTSPENLEFEISRIKLGFLPLPAKFIVNKFLDEEKQNELLSFQNGKIILHNIENEQFRMENIYFDEGYMTATILINKENFDQKMFNFMLNTLKKLPPEEKINLIKKLLEGDTNLNPLTNPLT